VASIAHLLQSAVFGYAGIEIQRGDLLEHVLGDPKVFERVLLDGVTDRPR
jgi:hypothetical protein